MKNDFYTIAGICTSGARFYSEILPNNDKVISLLDKYAGIVGYFGGGTLYVYHTVDDICEMAFSKKI